MSNNLAKRMLSTSLPILFFALGVILIMGFFVGIPYVLDNISNLKNIAPQLAFYALGVSYLLIIIFLGDIVSSSKISIFVNENVKRFKKIGYLLLFNLGIEYISMIMSGMHGLRFLDLAPGIFITPSMAIYFVAALLCFVIADSFEEAIKIKDENNLTI